MLVKNVRVEDIKVLERYFGKADGMVPSSVELMYDSIWFEEKSKFDTINGYMIKCSKVETLCAYDDIIGLIENNKYLQIIALKAFVKKL